LEVDNPTLKAIGRTGGGSPTLTFAAPPIEINAENPEPVQPGSRTSNFRVIDQTYGERKLTLVLDGRAGSEGTLGFSQWIRRAGNVKISVDPPYTPTGSGDFNFRMETTADYAPDTHGVDGFIQVKFPPGDGWKTITVTLTW
jgi:hypothetical protein